MQNHPIVEILNKWPNRQAIADDAGVDLFAVHRWYQRKSVNGIHDAALLNGAKRRGIRLSADEIAVARSVHNEQAGHATRQRQGKPAEKAKFMPSRKGAA